MNMTIGGLSMTPERSAFFEPTEIYVQGDISFAFKQREATTPPIKRFMAPFNTQLWIFIFGILFCSTLILLLTKKLSRKWRHFYIGGRMNRAPVFNMWTSFFGHPIANTKISSGRYVGNFARSLTLFWVFMWFFVRSHYEAILYENLVRDRFLSAYDTTEKIQSSNCIIVVRNTAFFQIANFVRKHKFVQLYQFIL